MRPMGTAQASCYHETSATMWRQTMREFRWAAATILVLAAGCEDADQGRTLAYRVKQGLVLRSVGPRGLGAPRVIRPVPGGVSSVMKGGSVP